MGAVKVMSIIGIVLFALGLVGSFVGEYDRDIEALFGIGILMTVYGISFAITALVQANKVIKQNK